MSTDATASAVDGVDGQIAWTVPLGKRKVDGSASRGVSVRAACTGQPDGQWLIRRFGFCLEAGVTYTARDVRTQLPVGGASFVITQSTELDGVSTDWTEHVSLHMVEGSTWGVVGAMTATWSARCDSDCEELQDEPFPAGTPIVPGETLTGDFVFQDPQPVRGGADAFSPFYTLELVSPGSLGDEPLLYEGPQMRCDFQVGTTAGCIVNEYTPTFNVDAVAFPLAAAGVRWAQGNLPNHPGLEGEGAPVNRLANVSAQQANRRRICQTGWTPLTTVVDDSCDEFPFAATTQGGSMAGPDCAEIVPLADGSVTVRRDVSSVTTCVRAHVPKSQNTDVGGDLGQWVQEQRIVDNEEYWVSTF